MSLYSFNMWSNIHKKGEFSHLFNYRPISLIPISSKIMEKIIKCKKLNFIEEHNILSKNQYAFKAELYTIKAANRLLGVISKNMEKGLHVAALF